MLSAFEKVKQRSMTGFVKLQIREILPKDNAIFVVLRWVLL
jgi:hypothetical protein